MTWIFPAVFPNDKWISPRFTFQLHIYSFTPKNFVVIFTHFSI